MKKKLLKLKAPKAIRRGSLFLCPVEGCVWDGSEYQTNYNRHYNIHRLTPKYICPKCGQTNNRRDVHTKHVRVTCKGSEEDNKAAPGHPGKYATDRQMLEAFPLAQEEADGEAMAIMEENKRLKIVVREQNREIAALRKALGDRDLPNYQDDHHQEVLFGPPMDEHQPPQDVPVPLQDASQSLQFENNPLVPPVLPQVVLGEQVTPQGEEAVPLQEVQDNPLMAAQILPPLLCSAPLPRRSGRVPEREKLKIQLAKVLSTSDPAELGLNVKNTDDMERGLFAARDIKAREWVVEYFGDFLSQEEADKRNIQRDGFSNYCLWFKDSGKWYCIDASEESGHPGRLANHSKKWFNLVPKKIPGEMRVVLRSVRDIAVGEELKFDYNDRRKEVLASVPWMNNS